MDVSDFTSPCFAVGLSLIPALTESGQRLRTESWQRNCEPPNHFCREGALRPSALLPAAVERQRSGRTRHRHCLAWHETIVIMEACGQSSRQRAATTACFVLPVSGIIG